MIELMVVVAVLAVLAATSIPTFIEVFNNNRLAGRSNEVLSMLQFARMESIRRGVRVVVCPSTNGTACVTGATWNGWIAFADINANGVIDADESLLSELNPAPMQLRSSSNISAGTGRIIFRPDGFAYRANGTQLLRGALRVCVPTRRPLENARDISISISRISVAPADAGATCAIVPSNPA